MKNSGDVQMPIPCSVGNLLYLIEDLSAQVLWYMQMASFPVTQFLFKTPTNSRSMTKYGWQK